MWPGARMSAATAVAWQHMQKPSDPGPGGLHPHLSPAEGEELDDITDYWIWWKYLLIPIFLLFFLFS